MPIGPRYKVSPRQAELVKEWMRKQPKYDGGVSFSADFAEIYKSDITNLEKTK